MKRSDLEHLIRAAGAIAGDSERALPPERTIDLSSFNA